ncbi:hypothetical protein [Arthrobacter celericrescens]|uniref:hypothetical protein n=1 Tax=Arthrobacter celericrescens TaxID=2320851 RepID=UPI000EA25773|nr:hypothetical protein [Arthrobacter celericrescens]
MNRPGPDSADQSANKDDDAVWLDLVARLEAMPDEIPDPTEDLPGGLPDTRPDADGTGLRPSRFSDYDPLGLSRALPDAADSGDALPGSGPRDYEAAEDDGTFVPEDPPSLAGTEPLTMLAWVGAVGGPLALLFTAMFWRSAPLPAVLGMVAAFLAAVVYLIMRLPREKDDYDDGARV